MDFRGMKCDGGEVPWFPRVERLWGRKNAVNATTMEETMKTEKEKIKMQTGEEIGERRKRRGRQEEESGR
ncbi:uncharacterized protein AFUA_2G08810 [Aspergillus fumigatus Af293]|jgi:hypothetical protein|uniref:Uncharacterized protein n=1 Tax=Aspergillus fumigatus (strain ATCC MYA-4609 / CBS 101355 / FGSC A1100 / Af293) TaxID=330879 RepID=Q4X1T8_ASPFU|nr:conserved hypothetical protein [Aspergillus fumigatus Af293]EAL93177.2 conserved hypothetical protein [Aspergillus fumigatus Af293]